MGKGGRFNDYVKNTRNLNKELIGLNVTPGDFEQHLENNTVSFTEKEKEFLEKYFESLNSIEPGIGERAQLVMKNAEEIKSLERRLEEEIKTALNEDIELENIAKQLQDKELVDLSRKDKKHIRRLGRKLETFQKRSSKITKLENKLDKIVDSLGVSEIAQLEDDVSFRKSKVELILSHGTINNKKNNEPNYDVLLKNIEGVDNKKYDIPCKRSTGFAKYIYYLSACLEYMEEKDKFSGDLTGELGVVEPVDGEIPWMKKVNNGVWMGAGVKVYYPDEDMHFIILDSRLKKSTPRLIGAAQHEFLHWIFPDKGENAIQKDVISTLDYIASNYEDIVKRKDLFQKYSDKLGAKVKPGLISKEEFVNARDYSKTALNVLFS